MKPIIGKIVNLIKANGGELEWNALDQKTRTAFYNELKKSFEKLFEVKGKIVKPTQLSKLRVK